MECRLAGLLFTSKFDSGNLARVERVGPDDDDEDGTAHRVGDAHAAPDYEFNLWTNPDCGGTEFENGNRTWFHFAVKGCPMNKLIKFNIMNMNKQGKLYSQGLAPVVKVLPQKTKWERIRDRPHHESVDGQFILSFTYRFEYRFSTVYFAFCYPYSYTEYQDRFTELDNKFSSRNYNSGCPNSAIYYHREVLCHSLDKLRVDLITISSCHGLTTEREPRLHRLFPDTATDRARRFRGKRVYFLSSRVHPGETPASFVFNGFLDFILRTKDERAIQLRKQYVFKLVPLLNPDGVQRGYYRTDQRGVNLNRVYLNPDPDLHPSIFAAKSVVLHHHVSSRVVRSSGDLGQGRGISAQDSGETPVSSEGLSGNERTVGSSDVDGTEVRAELGKNKFVIEKKGVGANAILVVHRGSKDGSSASSSDNGQKRHSPNEEGSMLYGDGRAPSNNLTFLPDSASHNGKEVSRDDASVDDSDVESDVGVKTQTAFSSSQSNNNAQTMLPLDSGDTDPMSIPSEESGVAFYVDLHGHASKRGCFIYGNFHDDEERQTENLLFPKLIAMNSAHFDFDGCNFTEKNMYSKDRRDGMSKEGSGRVGIYKATGIIHSYTLECNYNSGRFVNSLSPASNDDGRATPPPLAGYPPKYGPQHYEEVGRATAIAALDITDTNPWSRLTGTESGSVHGVRSWIQRYIRSMRGAPSLPRKMSRVASKTSSLVATVMTPPKPNRTNLFYSGNSGNTNGTNHSNPQSMASNSPKRNMHSKPLGPVRETRASMERRKHLATLQGTGISTSTPSSSAASSTTTTTTMGVASALGSGGKNFTIPLPLTHHKQSPPSTSRSLKAGPAWAHKKNKSDSVLGKNAGESSSGQKELGNQLSPRTLLSKSTNNLGAFTRHGGPLASSTLPSVVTELLNSVMINALEGSKDTNREESKTFSSASTAQQRTAMFVKNHHGSTVLAPSSSDAMHTVKLEFPPTAPSALSHKGPHSMFPRHHMTIDLGTVSSQHHGNIHVEGEKGDLKALGSLCLHEESRQDSADKTKKRRKKVNGPKRRSISHSPSRKSQKNSHRALSKGGKHSETDSDPERLMNRRMERTRQRSLTSSLSDPTPNDLNPMSEHTTTFTTNLDRQTAITPKRSRSISSIPEPSHLRPKVRNPIKKSNSFTGERRDSSVSYQVVELNDLKHRRQSQKTPIPVKKIGFWVDF